MDVYRVEVLTPSNTVQDYYETLPSCEDEAWVEAIELFENPFDLRNGFRLLGIQKEL